MGDWWIKFREAERTAELVLADNGMEALPVDPHVLAEKSKIKVLEHSDGDPGFSGCLMRSTGKDGRDKYGIIYSSHIENNGFKRFTIAHELGHYFLDGHAHHLFGGGKSEHRSRGGFTSQDFYELQADHFAAALLMPTKLFKRKMARAGEGFRAIESLAGDCITSITSTAIRYAKLAKDVPVAVIVSEGEQVVFSVISKELMSYRGVSHLRAGSLLPKNTRTWNFNSDPSNVTSCARKGDWTNLDEWFDGADDYEVKEDVVGLGRYGKTLSVLFASDDGDEDDSW